MDKKDIDFFNGLIEHGMLPYIAEFDKSKNIWRLQGQESDNTIETHYINNDCIPSSWKIIENSPEWKKSSK